MKHLKMVLFFTLILCSVVPAQAQSNDAQKLETALRQQADAWDTAIVTKNVDAIAANMGESFYMVDSDGLVETKQSFINNITSPDLVFEPFKVEEFKVRVYGETAIVNGVAVLKGTYKTNAFTSRVRYTDVYVKEGNTWRVVSVQTTRIK